MKKNLHSKLLQESSFFRECLAEREAISQHRRAIGQSSDHEVSFEEALVDWMMKKRGAWLKNRRSHRQ